MSDPDLKNSMNNILEKVEVFIEIFEILETICKILYRVQEEIEHLIMYDVLFGNSHLMVLISFSVFYS